MKADEMEPLISHRLSCIGAESRCEVLGELPARRWALAECTACCSAGGMWLAAMLEGSFFHYSSNQQSVRKRRREIIRNHTKMAWISMTYTSGSNCYIN